MSFLEAFSLVLPIFFLVGLGAVAMRSGLLGESSLEGLNLFVFRFAIPALLFRAILGVDIPETLPFALWGSYYGAILIIWILSPLLTLLLFRSRPKSHHVTFAFGSTFPNIVLVGVPVTLAAYGDDAAFPLFLIFAIHSLVFLVTVTLALDHLTKGSAPSFRETLKSGVAAILQNWVIMAILLGFLYGLLMPPLPAMLDRPLALLGEAGIPTALFLMGATLSRYRMERSLPPAILMVSMKLIAHPALVYLLGRFLFDLPPLYLAVATVIAALPNGIFLFILSENYKAAPGAASSALLLSTAVSVLTLPLVLSALAPP